MKLEIIVPHYKEPYSTIRPLLESINTQTGVNWDDVRVCIVNDGEDGMIPDRYLRGFNYTVWYDSKAHEGLSAVRNYGIDYACSDYIMFCDADDRFLNNWGLHLILAEIDKGFDMLISPFVEEQPSGDGWTVYRHDNDIVFCHGKVYRTEFLWKKNLRFPTHLGFCEDSVFNKLAFHEAEKVAHIDTPFYLWCWNPSSTTRSDRELIVLRRFREVMGMREAICEGLKQRGYEDEYLNTVCKCMFDTYYDLQHPTYLKPENAEMYKAAEEQARAFVGKYAADFIVCDVNRAAPIMMDSRKAAYMEGMYCENLAFGQWLALMVGDAKS